jgi:DNA repair protein RecO (recombination protein O)
MRSVVRALVLKKSEYRDFDRMVTLLSPERGRIDAVARACRKPKSALMNAAEVFCAGDYTIDDVRGRQSIVGCEIHESFYPLRQNLEALTQAAYAARLLITAALPGQGAEGLFQLALNALAHWCYGSIPPELVTMVFELHYLKLLGQAPMMDQCVACGQALDGEAGFDVARGGALCARCAGGKTVLTNGARRILLRVPMTKFAAVDKLDGHPDWPTAAKYARAFLDYRL